MKYIWLMGGFGNILFQIIAFRVLKRTNEKVKYINMLTENNLITKVLKWTIHQRLYDDFIKTEDIKKVNIVYSIYTIIISLISKMYKLRNNFSTFYGKGIIFKEPYSVHNFGYFQDKFFLEKYKSEIKKLGDEIRAIYATEESKIVVHYRKGDSEWVKMHKHYYIKVRNLLKEERDEILVVTDSPEDARIFFIDCENINIINSKNAMEDFTFMVSAKKLYCAPSTFSWWAAHSLPRSAKAIMPKFFENTLGIHVQSDIQIIS